MLVGVDGGAEALVEAGYQPDLIVGDLHAVSDEMLRGGAEVVVRADHDGRAPGLERVQDIGVDAIAFPDRGHQRGRRPAAGRRARRRAGRHRRAPTRRCWSSSTAGRSGDASTFLVRLKLGGTLVDAKAASRLYRSRISAGALLLLVFVTLVAVGVILALAADGRAWTAMIAGWWDQSYAWVRGLGP